MTKADPPHPGYIVRKDCLEPHSLGVVEGARILGVSRQALSNLVNARAAISPEMAVRLAKAFGGSDESWLQLQLAYDLAQVRKRAHTIAVNPAAMLARNPAQQRLL